MVNFIINFLFIFILVSKFYAAEFFSLNKYANENSILLKYNFRYNYIELEKGQNKIKIFIIVPYIVYNDKIYYFNEKVMIGTNGQFEVPKEYLDVIKKCFFETNNIIFDNKILQNSNNLIVGNKENYYNSKFTNKKIDVYSKKEFTNQKFKNIRRINAIIIDPGHGGSDPGAISDEGIKESDIVFSISKRLYNIIKNDNKFKVFITRKSDKKTTLNERVTIASKITKKYTPIFISIHANFSFNKEANGIEVYSLSENATDNDALNVELIENAGFSLNDIRKTEELYNIINDLLKDVIKFESENLAKIIGNKIANKMNINLRGIKKANFYVLKFNPIPSILLEVGFLSNKKESKLLINNNYQDKISRAIYDGILEYINKFEENLGNQK